MISGQLSMLCDAQAECPGASWMQIKFGTESIQKGMHAEVVDDSSSWVSFKGPPRSGSKQPALEVRRNSQRSQSTVCREDISRCYSVCKRATAACHSEQP